jgi:hypothetical protein
VVTTKVFTPGTKVTPVESVLFAVLKFTPLIALPFCVNPIPCPLLEFRIVAVNVNAAFVTVVPFVAGETMLILGGMQLLYRIVIVSESVPQEFVVVTTKVFTPGTRVTPVESVLFAVLKFTPLIALPFCVNPIPCPLLEFRIVALNVKAAVVTVVPFEAGARIEITGATHGW